MLSPVPEARPLNVAIVGAELAGLATAVSLRRAGHIVNVWISLFFLGGSYIIQVFEVFALNEEIGASIIVPPNSKRILERLGYSEKNLRAVEHVGVSKSPQSGNKYDGFVSMSPSSQSCMCRRTDLHDELKRLALEEDGAGAPVHLHLSTHIVDCDPEAGILTSKSGEKYEANVIIAADGVNSTLRATVLGFRVPLPPSRICAFRWVLEASKLEGSEFDWVNIRAPTRLRSHRDRFETPYVFVSLPVMYEYKGEQGEDRAHVFQIKATRAEMPEECSDFIPKFQSCIELVPDTLNIWDMHAVPKLTTWTKGRVLFLGDAAHATFPTLGQGAAMAVEEAAKIGCLLPSGTTRERVPSRLEARQILCKERREFVGQESAEQIVIPAKRGLYYRCEHSSHPIIC
ncbi:FAD/NAD(P)-binding domain-containing protein [Mycena rebaudengoi]|nr:FAD/NAD(P)-binding domain-containing protein [Mycena rebaudengoi]